GPAGTLFWEHVLLSEVSRGAFEDLDLHLLAPVLPTQPNQFLALISRQALFAAGVDVVLGHPTAQTGLTNTEVLRDLANRCSRLADQLQGPAAELWRVWCRHLRDSFLQRSSLQIRCPGYRVRLRHTSR